ncbi:alpha/beta-hydrolase [Viridothelium virens]|uniref:Alpha/beta-hydrolase n=1 Tax=Viridothelium virens TaxID=1048519 RepID=A0A6A6HI94_VIRVR|nr:alpha/beta-hydrolase [Viridothelium virens]
MRAALRLLAVLLSSLVSYVWCLPTSQAPLVDHATRNRSVSFQVFAELEELARLVDISYCVGLTGTGIQKPFKCISRCDDFQDFELVTTWNTGQLMSDSCGYIALAHSPSNPRIIVAFRGTYSIANTVADLSTIPQDYVPYPDDRESPKTEACRNCTVHSGFYRSWVNTRSEILPSLETAIASYPNYTLTLVGHSLGGAVAGLASLDFIARGWNPRVATFGEPRLGNDALMRFIDQRFHFSDNNAGATGKETAYRRVTHVDDPVPLLPPKEWGFRMHAEEVYISKSELSPDVGDLRRCDGDEDPHCIAGADATSGVMTPDDLATEFDRGVHSESDMWNVPSKYKLWQLFFAHRDYFWRLGLCVPGGDPHDWGREYPELGLGDNEDVNSEAAKRFGGQRSRHGN